MGYSILGVIIFLIMLVFITDLIRKGREKDEFDEDFDAKEYLKHLSNQYPETFTFGEEFSQEFMDDENQYVNKSEDVHEEDKHDIEDSN